MRYGLSVTERSCRRRKGVLGRSFRKRFWKEVLGRSLGKKVWKEVFGRNLGKKFSDEVLGRSFRNETSFLYAFLFICIFNEKFSKVLAEVIKAQDFVKSC